MLDAYDIPESSAESMQAITLLLRSGADINELPPDLKTKFSAVQVTVKVADSKNNANPAAFFKADSTATNAAAAPIAAPRTQPGNAQNKNVQNKPRPPAQPAVPAGRR